MTNNWWAEGDTPVHADSRVTYLIDGRTTLLTMCRHFLMARSYIYLANWGVTSTMELVRGKDHRAGPDGSPEQEALVSELHAEGLQEAEIDFWCSHNLTVQTVLGYMANKGIEVTTPHAYKAGASGLTLVCRPTPIARFMHTSETWLKQLVYRMAQRTLGTLLLLLAGTIYRETPKQYSVVRVQKNSSHILFLHEKSGNVLPAGTAASIPTHERGGLAPRFGKGPDLGMFKFFFTL